MQMGNIEKKEDVFLLDSATTHTILSNKDFFSSVTLCKANVNTISGPANIIDGYGNATIFLPNGTILHLEDELLSGRSRRNLLSYKDVRRNGYHLETLNELNKDYLGIASHKMGQKTIHEKLEASKTGLYLFTIRAMELYATIPWKLVNPDVFGLWHDRLGHPGATMMRRIIKNTRGHPLKDSKVLLSKDYICESCSQGKLIIKPSITKVDHESPSFLQRIQGDMCGPIHPATRPFRYFMVLVDASCRWSHVCLLSTRNVAFARLLAQIIKLRAHFPDYQIKSIRMDNAGEFTSKSFDEYCASMGIKVEHLVPHVHTQNGLAESLIKRIQIIARTLLMRTKIPSLACGHDVLHAAALIRLCPTTSHQYSPLQLVLGYEPDISYFRTFGCAVQVPVAPPQRTKMGPQRRLGIYVGFDSSSIIRFLEPLTGDVFTARFADCHFDETEFPPLATPKTSTNGKKKKVESVFAIMTQPFLGVQLSKCL
ncbi:Integrase, catalytic core [Corchorus capsularis]|uniref:Integrase, catalytic core n=1 Tax=Corchorus capsularis TaxID=210143 RepID=A0A1R3K9F5_COCAP|nr:Integrase, catalytic core [Corchorus capsularis]